MPTPTRIRFAKLIATPHETSWSQAYNAGGLFIVFSLALTTPKAENTLNATGKDIVNNIEAEFFGLEEKTLDTIADALTEALKDIDPDITLNLCLAYNKDDVLYVFLKGSGKIIIKREGRIGALLQGTERDALKKASGRLKDGDKLLLATHAFTMHFSDEHIDKALSHDDPERGIEGLIPHLQDTKNGEIASLLLSYHEAAEETSAYALPPEQHVLNTPAAEEKPAEHTEENDTRAPDEAYKPTLEERNETEPAYAVPLEEETRRQKRSLAFPKVSVGSLKIFSNKRFLFLVIALILILILGVSVFKSVQKKTTTINNTAFHDIYDSAKKSYDEGSSLETLNKALAHDDFVKADEKLKEADGKFKPGSTEQQQIDTLKKQVEDKLGGTTSSHPIEAKIVDENTVPALKVAKNSSSLGLAIDGSTTYTLSDKAVTKNDSGKSTDVIKNESDWSDGVGLGVYLGNIYVLDKAKGILKFPSASDGFGKAVNYFSGSPDMSKALGMAIDGSVWILTGDGNILKFTRGASDGLKLSGLTSPLGAQGNIITSADMNSVYVLDSTNGRIVKFDKNGAYQTEYANSNFKGAHFFTVDEKNSKADVLSAGKIYEFPLQ